MNIQPEASTAAQDGTRTATSTVSPTPIRNTFEPLTEVDDDYNETDTEQERSQATQKPPTLAGKTQAHKQLLQNITKIANSDFHIKYTADNANLYFKQQKDKKKFLAIAN